MRIPAAALTCLLAAAAVAADAPSTQPDSSDSPVANTDAPDRANSPDNGGPNNGSSNNGPTNSGRPRRLQQLMDNMRNLRGRGGPGGPGGGPGMGGGFGGPMMDLSQEAQPSDDEWEKITDFCQENFPNRWKLYQRVRDARGDEAPLVQGIKLRFAARYRSLMKSQSDDSVYQAALTQGKLEDNALGISQQLQGDPDNPQIKQQLHDAVATLVKNQLDERGRRLKAAKEALDFEQARFDSDSQGIDQIVDNRLNRISNLALEFNNVIPAPTTAPSK